MSVTHVEKKFKILLYLPMEGHVDEVIAKQILELPHDEIAKFLGQGNVNAGKELIGRVTNYQLGQAIIFDLNQSQNFRLVSKPAVSKFPSIQTQLQRTEKQLHETQKDKILLEAKVDALRAHVKTLQNTIGSLQSTIGAISAGIQARSKAEAAVTISKQERNRKATRSPS